MTTGIKTFKNLPKMAETPEAIIPVTENIALGDICMSTINARKTYDKASLHELAESFKKVGVIQAITIRPLSPELAKKLKAKYEMVCGERRYHAAGIAGLKFIPASVRELTDAQAMEIMFTENIQRVDVPPMEEAEAFKMAIGEMNWTVTDISAKIGKPESYVVRRLQLVKLIEELKTIFRKDELSIGHAELLSRVAPQDQMLWFSKMFNATWNGDKGNQGTIQQLRTWLSSNTERQLKNATFKTDKPFEGRQYISARCTVCPQNSAFNNTLFPDTAEQAVCHNSHCFEAKTDATFEVLLKKALENPEVVLINESYGESKISDQLKKDGFTVLQGYSDYEKLNKPKISAWNNETEAQTEARREKAQQEYEAQKATSVKAFNVAGNDRGCVYTIVPKSKTALASASGSPDAARELFLADIKQKRDRGLELDAEKIMKRQVEAIKALPFLKEPTEDIEEITDVEAHALLCIAWEKCGHQCQELIKKKLGIKESYGYYSAFRILLDAPKYLKAFVIKNAAFNAFNAIQPTYINGPVIGSLAAHWNYGEFEKINAEQEGVRERREAKLNNIISPIPYVRK